MQLEISGTHVILAVAGNLIVWLGQFVALKTDMSWIKRRMRAGDARFKDQEEKEEQQDKQISRHRAEISAIKTACTSHHGTVFPAEGGD